MQQDLFSVTDKPNKKNTGLTISKAGKTPLSPNQQAFNKLTSRIEKLHKDLEKKHAQYDTAMVIYSTAIHPLRQQIAKHQRDILDKLWPVYKSRQLAKDDQRNLKAMLQEHLQDVFQSTEEHDEALKKMFSELEGESYESVKKREDAMMKEEVQEMLDNMNVDVDLGDIDIHDINFEEKLAQARQKMRENAEREQQQNQHQQRHQRRTKKTPKQMEAEKMKLAAEEMKQKNISTIYRQLAKLFHPDLEQDETLHAEKEELMKQLTAAYEAKNLHVLLSLEMQWIHKENDHLASLTEEKLGIYLQILREQAQQLENEKYRIFQKPQYIILYEDFGFPVTSQPLPFMKKEQQSLEKDIRVLQNHDNKLKSANALKHVKEMVREWVEDGGDGLDLDEMFGMLTSGFK